MAGQADDILEVADDDALIDRGLAADEDHDLDMAERILDEAAGRMGENHPRVLHLAGRIAWASGDIERASGFFQQATDLAPSRPEIYIDCARCLQLVEDDPGLAEEQVRKALALPALEPIQEGDARLLLAMIRLEDDDPEEALEVLDAIPDALKSQAPYLGALADVLLELDRIDEALVSLARAVEAEPGDPEYHYQRGLAQLAHGDIEGGTASMLRVLELDGELRGNPAAPTGTEIDALRGHLEEAMAELPDPLLHLVANVPITVQASASEAQVRAGADPRAAVFFEGKPKLDDAVAEPTGVVVLRDVLLDEVEDDDELTEALLVALVAELTDFFGREDLVFEEAST